MQHSPGGHLRGLWTDSINFLWTKAQEEYEDQSDQEAGQ